MRRVWAKRGQRPRVKVQPRYQWRYLHGFVEPRTGRTFWWLTSWIDTQAFNLALREFAAWAGVDEATPLLLVLDQASWHRSQQVALPPGISLVFLPPYSPELQPAERLWPLSNEAICNQHFAAIHALEEAQCQRCRQLALQTDLVRAYTHFKWWP